MPPSESSRSRSKVSIRGGWNSREDQLLASLVEKSGTRDWNSHAAELNRLAHGDSGSGRTGKQCRERWHNHLRPDIITEPLSEQEQLTLMKCHRRVGNKWSVISESMPGRTENQLKNYMNATIRMREMLLRCKSDVEIENALDRCLRLRCRKFTEYVFQLPDLESSSSQAQESTSSTIDKAAAAEEGYRKRQKLIEMLARMPDSVRSLGARERSRTTSAAADDDDNRSERVSEMFLSQHSLTGSVKRGRGEHDIFHSCASDIPSSTGVEIEAPCHVTLDSLLSSTGHRSSRAASPGPGRFDDWNSLPSLLDAGIAQNRDMLMSTMPNFSRDFKRRYTRNGWDASMRSARSRTWEDALENDECMATYGEDLMRADHRRTTSEITREHEAHMWRSCHGSLHHRAAPMPARSDNPRYRQRVHGSQYGRAFDTDPWSRSGRDMQLASLPELEDVVHRPANTIDNAHECEMSASSNAFEARRQVPPPNPRMRLRLPLSDNKAGGDPFDAYLPEGDYNPFNFSPRSEAGHGSAFHGSIDQLVTTDPWYTSASDYPRQSLGNVANRSELARDAGCDDSAGGSTNNALWLCSNFMDMYNSSGAGGSAAANGAPGAARPPAPVALAPSPAAAARSRDVPRQGLELDRSAGAQPKIQPHDFWGTLPPQAGDSAMDANSQRHLLASVKPEQQSDQRFQQFGGENGGYAEMQASSAANMKAFDGLMKAQEPLGPLQGSPRWEHMLEALTALQNDM